MSYGYESGYPGYEGAMPAAYSQPSERAIFMRRTYLHLAGAILAFVLLETAIFATFGVGNILNFLGQTLARSPYSWLIVVGLFMGAGYLARIWARSRTSIAMQYVGLGLYVVAQAIVMLPLLTMAAYFAEFEGIIPQAGILTLMLFGGLTTAALVTRKDFSFLGPILSIGGWLLLGMIVIAILMPGTLVLGSWFCFLVIALAGASILYTTSNMMFHYSTDMYVAAALELFAAIATLFYYILMLLMNSRR